MSKYDRLNSEDPMNTLCRMVVQTKYDDLPPAVVQYAKQSILDIIGVIIGGSAMEGILPVVKIVKDKAGKPESYIPLHGGKVPAANAAFAIGSMTRAMDFAQIHPVALHCSEHVIAPLLALASKKGNVSGRDFITAFAMGQEVILRIGVAWRVATGKLHNLGSGHYIFGSVAGAGKLLGLDQEILENAEGIAREMNQPYDRAAFYPPTHMIKVHMGFVAQDAVTACLLAKRGTTGPRNDVLLGFRGYFNTVAKWETDPDFLTQDLGEKWEMMNAEVKPYTGTKFLHSSIHGIIDQKQRHDFKADDIDTIHIEQAPLGYHLIGTPEMKEKRWNPKDIYEFQYSLPFVVASAAYDGDVFITSFEEKARNRSEVRNLMSRISVSADEQMPVWAARLTTTLKNGKKYTNEFFARDVKGHPENMFSEKELIEKFKKSVPYSIYKIPEKSIDSLIDAILNMEKVQDVVDTVINPLVPA